MAQQVEDRTPFSADPGDELPVGVQLAWRLRALIAAGRLAAGDRMPSVRTLADWAGVNVNTVRGVYARLEDEGLIVTRHGRGSFVADDAGGSPEVERIAAEAIEAAADAGVDPRDVAIATLVSAALPEGLEPDLPAEPTTRPRTSRPSSTSRRWRRSSSSTTSGWRRTSSARGGSCGARSAASRRSSRAIAATWRASGPRG